MKKSIIKSLPKLTVKPGKRKWHKRVPAKIALAEKTPILGTPVSRPFETALKKSGARLPLSNQIKLWQIYYARLQKSPRTKGPEFYAEGAKKLWNEKSLGNFKSFSQMAKEIFNETGLNIAPAFLLGLQDGIQFFTPQEMRKIFNLGRKKAGGGRKSKQF